MTAGRSRVTLLLAVTVAVLAFVGPAAQGPAYGDSLRPAAVSMPLTPPIMARSTQVGLVSNGRTMADCTRRKNPDKFGYASGFECPPEGFPYEPELKMTDSGLRAMDPWDNGCSFSPDTDPAHDFRNACATHDYMADLQRFGAKGVSEPGMDHVFLTDMLNDCDERSFFARKTCQNTAGFFRAWVQEGNYAIGDEIEDGR